MNSEKKYPSNNRGLTSFIKTYTVHIIIFCLTFIIIGGVLTKDRWNSNDNRSSPDETVSNPDYKGPSHPDQRKFLDNKYNNNISKPSSLSTVDLSTPTPTSNNSHSIPTHKVPIVSVVSSTDTVGLPTNSTADVIPPVTSYVPLTRAEKASLSNTEISVPGIVKHSGISSRHSRHSLGL